jgi:hypothetical protein
MELIKMTNPMIRIHNTETDKIVDREMNVTELAQYTKDLANQELQAAEQMKVATQKAALLAKLGITEDEAKLLLS